VYFGTGDTQTEPAQPLGDAIVAVDMDSGKVLWSYQAQPNDAFMGGCGGQNKSKACPQTMGPDADIGNPPILSTLPDGRRMLIAGVVFVGGTDGKLHALSTTDGNPLWEFDTAKDFDTVNKVADAHGGAISSVGPVIVGGMMYIGSGYGVGGGPFGNVLLAFGP